MVNNYLKTAFRNLYRHKIISVINIAGLSVGLACTMLIMLWVQNELSYDRFHQHADQIYRVNYEEVYKGRTQSHDGTQALLGPAMKSELPEIREYVRIGGGFGRDLFSYRHKQFYVDRFILADPSLFTVFSFPFLKGDAQSALNDFNSLVITEEMAHKFFGDEDPLGKTIQTERGDYKVTGVLKNIPHNSEIQFNCVSSFSRIFQKGNEGNTGWGVWNYSTFVLLSPGYPPSQVEMKLSQIAEKYLEHHDIENNKLRYWLQPLTRIHLYSDFNEDTNLNSNLTRIYIFTAITFLILAMACINYMNLTTAHSILREKEVGVRKTAGASRLQLIRQFLGESLLISSIAFLLSMVLLELLLPAFNSWTDKRLEFHPFANYPLIFLMLSMAALVGLVSGSYPAFLLSSFHAADVLKSKMKESSQRRSSLLRKLLLTIQFSLSIFFIACTVAVYWQLEYIRTKNLGYDKENLLAVPIFYKDVLPRYELLKHEIMKSPDVISATATSYLPSNPGYRQNMWCEGIPAGDNSTMMSWIPVDYDFVKTFKIKLTAGRDFSREFSGDFHGAYILNETAAKWAETTLGWKNPLGKQINIGFPGKVIGVIKDFHFKSLHEKINPVALNLYPEVFQYIIARLQPGKSRQAVDFIQDRWNAFVPEHNFDYFFLDEDFDRLYKSDMRTGQIFTYVAGLAILIACLGLLGLTSFAVNTRIKEIGVRKVFGASTVGITALFFNDFSKPLLVSMFIAWPIAYYVIHQWLQNFAYKIEISWWIFILSGGIALVIALLTVSYQAIKVATRNPVEALRYE